MWIHWSSPVTRAKSSIASCVTSCQSLTPSSSPTLSRSSSKPLIVSMRGSLSRAWLEERKWAGRRNRVVISLSQVAGPLLVVDTPSLLYRAFFALPKSITDDDGHPVNALLGTANLVLFVVERRAPRAVVLCWGAEAAVYRTELYAPYHADRPPMPPELERQWLDAPAFFGAFGWQSIADDELEADDLLGSLARVEAQAGGEVLIFTGDRDMFQCVSEAVTVLFPRGGKD